MRITGAVLEELGRPGPWARSRPLSVGELELEAPGPGEVLVQIAAAGVCHSDLSVVNGNRARPVPMLLGHEASGRVAALGSGVTDFAVGQQVVMTFLPRCGSCAGCATGAGCWGACGSESGPTSWPSSSPKPATTPIAALASADFMPRFSRLPIWTST